MRALRTVPDFAHLDDRTLLKILGASANLHWTAGTVVFEKGTPGDALYIVLSGEVSVFDPDDDDPEIARVGPGGYFGDLSLFLGQQHSKSVRAVEDTELMVIPKASFEVLLEADEELADHFRRVFEDRAASFRP